MLQERLNECHILMTEIDQNKKKIMNINMLLEKIIHSLTRTKIILYQL